MVLLDQTAVQDFLPRFLTPNSGMAFFLNVQNLIFMENIFLNSWLETRPPKPIIKKVLLLPGEKTLQLEFV